MRLNADQTRPVFVHGARLDWVPRPATGVDRRMLNREGAEVARATSIMRYAPGSAFPEHVHSGGEDIRVLDGTFQDEHHDYAAGSYFRNPPGTVDSPAAGGCTIFVRFWQYRSGDDVQIVRQPGEGAPVPPRPGVHAARVWIEDGEPGAEVAVEIARGLEILLIASQARLDGEDCGPESWGRLPAGQALSTVLGPQGAQVWIKATPPIRQSAAHRSSARHRKPECNPWRPTLCP